MSTLIITDNPQAKSTSEELQNKFGGIEIFQSKNGKLNGLPEIDVKKEIHKILGQYQLVISMHCQQIFPEQLVDSVRCINVHPGYNPFNRGWYPHVFSIINGLPAGVTIHEMDKHIDHGKIIVRKECVIKSFDTSGSVYHKIMDLERNMVFEFFPKILSGKYESFQPTEKGTFNTRKDYEKLKQINLAQYTTYQEVINHFRALTHEPYQNLFYLDKDGQKSFVKIDIQPQS